MKQFLLAVVILSTGPVNSLLTQPIYWMVWGPVDQSTYPVCPDATAPVVLRSTAPIIGEFMTQVSSDPNSGCYHYDGTFPNGDPINKQYRNCPR